MRFFKLFVNNRVVVYIFVLLILVAGIFSYATLPREASPSIEIPYVFVSTVYPGVSPQEMEKLVTMEIEKEVKGISDVKKVTSVSRESFSSVVIEFQPNVKIDDALQKVRDKVNSARASMPQDIQEPVINEINFSELPMLYVNISGNYGLAKLKDIADNLSDKIEAIPGVLSAEVIGGLDREVKINVDADKLKYYGVSLNDVTNAIKNENLSMPGGGVDIGNLNYLVRVPGEIEDPAFFANLVVKTYSGNSVFLRDVAEVVYGFKDRTTYARQNGVENVIIVIRKQSGQNIVRIADQTKALVNQEKKNLPEGINITFTGDFSKFIRNTVHELENGVITGMLLVVGILFLFLGIKNASLTATSIPLSFLISFIVLDVMGITLNMIVLFTLILVLGIIVDDAIVVMENIYRLQEKEGYNAYDASLQGPREVAVPVTIATLTILSSFFPLLFFPGIVGEFMRYLPITLIVCLSSSLFVAMVISPVQASLFINVQKDREKAARKKFRPVSKFIEAFDKKFFDAVLKSYEKSLRFSLRHRKLTIGGTVALLFIMFFLYAVFNNGVEFFPSVDPRQVNVNITLPSGTTVEKTNAITKQLENKVPTIPGYSDIEFYSGTVGRSNNVFDFGGGVSNKSIVTIDFVDKLNRKQSSFRTIDEIRQAITNLPGVDVVIQRQQMGPPTGPPVNIEIAGDDFIKLGQLSREIQATIKDVPGLTDLKDDFNESRPEIKVTIDREKAALYKLNTASIASTIRTAINGTAASKYRKGDEEYDITVRLKKDQRSDVTSIQNLYVANNDGTKIPLTSVAAIQFGKGIEAINRKDQKRVVTISGNATGRLGNDVLNDVKAKLADFKLPDGYLLSYTGEREEQEQSSSFLAKAFIISLLLIFLFMVMEFNSVRTPLIIMFSVLLSLIGVLAGLLITKTPFGIMMTGIGVISLGGIVVRNAIVMLDFQKVLQKGGMSRDESLVKAGVIRLRPIFLTAACTMLGLVPLTTGVDFDWRTFSWIIGGENTAFWRPMGVAIIFGLSVSTFLTLVIIPTIYASVDDMMSKLKAKFRPKVLAVETGKQGK